MGDYVTPDGLQIPTVQDLLTKTASDQRSTIDPNLNTDADSPIGQMNGIVCNDIRRAYEILELAWDANDPDQAEGSLLDAVSLISGTKRAPSTPSKFVGQFQVKVNLNAGTVLPVNSGAAVFGNLTVSFHTTSTFTAPSGGGAADYFVDMACDVDGPTVCNANTLTVITTPVSGWNSVINPFDAVPGTDQDKDPQLRIRREKELRATGLATVDAMAAKLLAIELADGTQPVLQAVVFSNDQDFPDGNGLPGHSMRALVFDGVAPTVANNVIAQVIWNCKPGGILLTSGTGTYGTAVDSLGNARTIPFDRPVLIQIVFSCTLTLTNANQTPAQYLAVVTSTIIAEFAIKVKMGSVIRVRHYEGKATDIEGIEDCVIRVGIFGGSLLAPDTNLALGVFEMGFVETTGITVS